MSDIEMNPDFTIIFGQEYGFSTRIVELITICVTHLALFILEIIVVFTFGHPDDDKFNYGLVSKIVVIIGMHSIISWLIANAVDFSLQEWDMGYTEGFVVGKYLLLAFIWKEVVSHFVLTYSTYYVDADNDRGILRPWSKALIWSLIKITKWFIVYLIFYACEKDRSQAVVCQTLNLVDQGIADGPYQPEYGEPGCLAECALYWRADPSVCLRYSTYKLSAHGEKSFPTSLLNANIIIGYLGYSFFLSVGLVTLPIQQWYKLKGVRTMTPLKDDELKVKNAELTEMAAALKTVGVGLRNRTTHLTRKDLSHVNPKFLYLDHRIQTDYNRWVRGCFVLFEQKKRFERRKQLGSNSPPKLAPLRLPWQWFKFICSVILTLGIVIHMCIFQIADSLTPDPTFHPSKSPLTLIMKAVHDLNVFPLTICIYLFNWGVLIWIVLIGYRGTKLLWPQFGVPIRPMKKGRVRVREMTEQVKIILIISSAFPYIQARNQVDALNGTWTMRNFISVTQYSNPDISNAAPIEWFSLILMIVSGIWCLIKKPRRMPFGLDEFNCATKPFDIVRQWDTGIKDEKDGKKSKLFSTEKVKGKVGRAKNKAVMGAVKKNAGM